MKLNEETYIGDGVYVRFDGYQTWLRVDHERALEPEVYDALVRWSDALFKEMIKEGLQ